MESAGILEIIANRETLHRLRGAAVEDCVLCVRSNGGYGLGVDEHQPLDGHR